MASIENFSLRHVLSVGCEGIVQKFKENKRKITDLTFDLQAPHFYRNRNLAALAVAVLFITIAVIHYNKFIKQYIKEKTDKLRYDISLKFEQEKRWISERFFYGGYHDGTRYFHNGEEVRDYVLKTEYTQAAKDSRIKEGIGWEIGDITDSAKFIASIQAFLISAIGMFAVYALARSKTHDQRALDDLNKQNDAYRANVQEKIDTCKRNIKNCDIAMDNKDVEAGALDGGDAAAPLTPWEALKAIADPNSVTTLNKIQGDESQGQFLQSQQNAIRLFRQENEVAQDKLGQILTSFA